jgi:uncharacterized protein (DUF952 family)
MKYYQGHTNLLLLCIDNSKLQAPLVYEDSYQSGEDFPHVCGPLNLEAVVHVFDFIAGEDGYFHLPDDFLTYCAGEGGLL